MSFVFSHLIQIDFEGNWNRQLHALSLAFHNNKLHFHATVAIDRQRNTGRVTCNRHEASKPIKSNDIKSNQCQMILLVTLFINADDVD